MKITHGVFPWAWFYGPLVAFVGCTVVALTATDSWGHSVFPALGYIGAAFMAWWVFLMVRSGVAPGRLGTTYRESNPTIFWSYVAFQGLLGVVFLAFAAIS
jgi:hypothetical protein